MKKTAFLIFFIFSIFICSSQKSSTCTLLTNSNFTVLPPKDSVKQKTPKPIERLFNKLSSKNSGVYIFDISEVIQIYILVNNDNSEKAAYFLAYNKIKNKSGVKPIRIDLRWGYNREEGFSKQLTESYIHTLQNEGQIMILLDERAHNGNSYNAIVTKVYELKTDMELTLKFCFEKKSLLSFDGTVITREFTGDKIESFIDNRLIGCIDLNPKTFSILSRNCLNELYSEQLITTSGEDELEFYKIGYTIWY